MQPTSDRREPRFVFLSDALPPPSGTPDDRLLAGATRGRYGWRLDAANHRTLGRAASVAASLEACVSAARLIRDRIRDVEPTIAADAQRGAWTWRVDVDGRPLAVSPHTFARRVECQRAFVQFCQALAVARPDAGVVRHFGPRALRAFDIDLAVS